MQSPDQPPLDMPSEEFRRHAHETSEWIADFLSGIDEVPVSPVLRPGDVRRALPDSPPDSGEPMDAILADFRDVIVPAMNHWNHPSAFGYFCSSGSGPGILGEMLAATLNVNAMVWKSSPAATELEDLTTDWLRILLGLPEPFEGVINDTASSSSLYALAAARERTYPEAHRAGLFGLPAGRVYASDQAHSSIEKAVLTLGLGQDGYRRIASDDHYRMSVPALREAMALDAEAGLRPVAVVATLGTTSSAAIDPVAEIAEVAEEYGAWLHVDAAYGGSAAVVPETAPLFAGWERGDSVVVNPHKWLFTPLDCSVLFCRRPEMLMKAFSLVPEYLTSADQSDTRSLMDYGVSLGRRFRALKLWFVLRYFGRDGLVERLRGHMAMAREFADAVRAEPGWDVVAPVELGAVAFRYAPAGAGESGAGEAGGGDDQDALNLRIMDRVNASGQAFLTHTALSGRTVLRLAIGHLRTTPAHVEAVWSALRASAAAVP